MNEKNHLQPRAPPRYRHLVREQLSLIEIATRCVSTAAGQQPEPARKSLKCYDRSICNYLPRTTNVLGIWQTGHWDDLTRRIGWLTYEEMVSGATQNRFLAGERLEALEVFMRQRELWPSWPRRNTR